MSRVIKSENCIEALPCRLEPVEGDAFFISKKKNKSVEKQVPETPVIDPQVLAEQMRAQADNVLNEARRDAEQIIMIAQKEAEAIFQATRLEAEAILQAARVEAEQIQNEAFNSGRESGLEQIRHEMTDELAAALEVLEEAENERLVRIKDSEIELLRLAVAIAEKIIDTELQQNPESQVEIVRQALQRATGASSILVKVHPDFITTVSNASTRLQKVFNEPRMIRFEADSHLEPGDCFVETEQGNIDARLREQLERILTELYKLGRLE